jgi:hypothetical protein
MKTDKLPEFIINRKAKSCIECENIINVDGEGCWRVGKYHVCENCYVNYIHSSEKAISSILNEQL